MLHLTHCAGLVQGHGPCDDYSRSVTLPRFIASTSDIAKEAKILLKMLAIPPQELRGVGLAVCHTSVTLPLRVLGLLNGRAGGPIGLKAAHCFVISRNEPDTDTKT